MITYPLTLLILSLCLAASTNYVAYNHVQRYRYYKSTSRVSFEQRLTGIILGLPLIFVPFVLKEQDREFLKYDQIKIDLSLIHI